MTPFAVFVADTYDDADDDTCRWGGKNARGSFENAGIPTAGSNACATGERDTAVHTNTQSQLGWWDAKYNG